jgi:hypothetical protein
MSPIIRILEFLSLEFTLLVEEIITNKAVFPRKIIRIAEKKDGGVPLIEFDKKSQFQNVEMKEINIDEVLAMSLARGDLFIQTASQRIFRLKRAGDFLEAEWKEKIKKHTSSYTKGKPDPAETQFNKKRLGPGVTYNIKDINMAEMLEPSFKSYATFNDFFLFS